MFKGVLKILIISVFLVVLYSPLCQDGGSPSGTDNFVGKNGLIQLPNKFVMAKNHPKGPLSPPL